jgi:hypothetical protein
MADGADKTPASKEKAAPKKSYTLLHPVRHDGKQYQRGAKLSLEAKDAKRLQELGHIAKTGTEAAEESESADE